MININPPNKISELLQLALDDLRVAEQTPNKFTVDMNSWVQSIHDACKVCLAGAVMVITLKDEIDGYRFPGLFPFDFSNGWESALTALDYIRQGSLHTAYHILDRSMPDGLPDVLNVVNYDISSTEWRENMEEIQAMLEAYGE